jgi:hypothetical protein
MVVRIACPGLPAPNNDAAALCRVATAQDRSLVSVAAGPIMASRFWRRQPQIGDLGPSWSVGKAGVVGLAMFRAGDTYQYGLGGGRVPTRNTVQEDAGLLACDVIVCRLVFARQSRARTLGDGVLGERLLLDGDGVGGDHGVFVIVECEHFGRDFHTDRIAFTAITVHYDTHVISFISP